MRLVEEGVFDEIFTRNLSCYQRKSTLNTSLFVDFQTMFYALNAYFTGNRTCGKMLEGFELYSRFLFVSG